MTVQVGQQLWYVPRERRFGGAPRWVTVAGVRRKWFDVEELPHVRFDVATLRADGADFESPGACHLDRTAWEAAQERDANWSRLRRGIDHKWSAPDGVSTAAIREAARLLGITLDQGA